MTNPNRTDRDRRTSDLLHAYRDGELSGLARWRLDRRLRRSPELRRALAELTRIGDWVRTTATDPAGPDLWSAIALRLPALDARRAEAGPHERGLGWLAWPGAVASAVITAAVAFLWLSQPTPLAARGIGVVRWIDSGPRDVMVLRASPDTTIVWVLGPPGKRIPRGENDKV